MRLTELFKQNPNIIINTDIDGILSGIILVKHLGCKIVGFTNSKDSVWLAEEQNDLYKHIYIDMFVTDKQAICIDQHIVAVNAEHQKKIIDSGSKYSPQIDGNKLFTDDDFKNKYPFGTFQYLIAVLESEGITISLPSLNTNIANSSITVGDLLLRADDSMKSSLYAYEKNAKKWWDWLKEKSGDAKVFNDLIDYLNSIRTSVETEEKKHNTQNFREHLKRRVESIKASTKAYFANNFSCRTGDGGFKNIIDDKNRLLSNIENYIRSIGNIMECSDLQIPSKYIVHKGQYCRTRWIDVFGEDFCKDYTICGHKVFSYAFIYGPRNDSRTNFSFTIDME